MAHKSNNKLSLPFRCNRAIILLFGMLLYAVELSSEELFVGKISDSLENAVQKSALSIRQNILNETKELEKANSGRSFSFEYQTLQPYLRDASTQLVVTRFPSFATSTP